MHLPLHSLHRHPRGCPRETAWEKAVEAPAAVGGVAVVLTEEWADTRFWFVAGRVAVAVAVVVAVAWSSPCTGEASRSVLQARAVVVLHKRVARERVLVPSIHRVNRRSEERRIRASVWRGVVAA